MMLYFLPHFVKIISKGFRVIEWTGSAQRNLQRSKFHKNFTRPKELIDLRVFVFLCLLTGRGGGEGAGLLSEERFSLKGSSHDRWMVCCLSWAYIMEG